MVSVVREHGFYYMKHHTTGKERRKYLGKSIPKNIKQLQNLFLREFYREEWSSGIQKIAKNYKSAIVGMKMSILEKYFTNIGIIFTHTTQRIEGSTLSEKDTKNLLLHKLTPSRKSSDDVIETQRHYNLFIKLISRKRPIKINQKNVLKWHKEIFGQTKIGRAGYFRAHMVGIVGNPKIHFTPVSKLDKKTLEFFKWLNNCKIKNPVEFAALAHYKFVSIHPFADGNGRISRLIMNYILFKKKCPIMIIEVKDKIRYFESLKKSQINNNEIYFLKWFIRYYVKKNKKYL